MHDPHLPALYESYMRKNMITIYLAMYVTRVFVLIYKINQWMEMKKKKIFRSSVVCGICKYHTDSLQRNRWLNETNKKKQSENQRIALSIKCHSKHCCVTLGNSFRSIEIKSKFRKTTFFFFSTFYRHIRFLAELINWETHTSSKLSHISISQLNICSRMI